MVMGNASGRKDGEGTSGVKEYGFEEEKTYEQYMEFAQSEGGGAHVGYHAQGEYFDPMVHSPPHSPRAYQPLLFLTPQVPMAPLPRPNEGMQVQNHALLQNITYYEDAPSEKRIPVMITWRHGGKQVFVTGTWDNWKNKELLHSSGNDFVIIKALLSGVYCYSFIVDAQVKFAQDLPWECDVSGIYYNVLDVQGSCRTAVHTGDQHAPKSVACLKTKTSFHMEQVPEALENLVDFESPSSPLSSYGNEPLNDADFSKNPPDLPPQLQMTLLNEPVSSQRSLPRPQQSMLNHFYIQNSYGGDHPVAIGSTHCFHKKYVTVALYKPSQK